MASIDAGQSLWQRLPWEATEAPIDPGQMPPHEDAPVELGGTFEVVPNVSPGRLGMAKTEQLRPLQPVDGGSHGTSSPSRSQPLPGGIPSERLRAELAELSALVQEESPRPSAVVGDPFGLRRGPHVSHGPFVADERSSHRSADSETDVTSSSCESPPPIDTQLLAKTQIIGGQATPIGDVVAGMSQQRLELERSLHVSSVNPAVSSMSLISQREDRPTAGFAATFPEAAVGMANKNMPLSAFEYGPRREPFSDALLQDSDSQPIVHRPVSDIYGAPHQHSDSQPFVGREVADVYSLQTQVGSARRQSWHPGAAKTTPAAGSFDVRQRTASSMIDIDLRALDDRGASSPEPVSQQFSEVATLRLDLSANEERLGQPLGHLQFDRASSSASQPRPASLLAREVPAEEQEASVVTSSRQSGINGPSEYGNDGLMQALTAHGAPSEWWHDSIILGRLSALALRYFAAKAAKRPYQAWRTYARSRLSKKIRGCRILLNTCRGVGFRSWRWQVLSTGRLANKMPLIGALQALVPLCALRPTWARLQQAVFLRRDLSRRLNILYLVERKMLATLARTHHYQRLLRLGVAGLWLAAQLRLNTAANRPASPRSDGRRTPAALSLAVPGQSRSHVAQVLRRAWRRWFFGVRMWLSHVEYNVHETEAWLTGEISTPRSIVTSNALQVLSPLENHFGDGGAHIHTSTGFLGHGGSWRLGDAAISPDQAFEEDEPLQLPFPSAVDDISPGLDTESSSPLRLETLSRHGYDGHNGRRQPRPIVRRRHPQDEEAPLPLPPHRQRRSIVMENTRQAAQEASNHRYRQDEQARLTAKSWETEGLRASPRTGMFDEGDAFSRRPTSRVIGLRRASESCSEADDVQFVEPEGYAAYDDVNAASLYSPSKGRPSHASQSPDEASDYWALRSRMGPSSSARTVTLRQR